ncbi:Peptidase M23/M37 family protein [Desulfamplus magnetovallimortis]|uniref:Peptidase M23/M37 family protein n=1 Tax=Desulfamplus magnetovallimortis TaxID=1246637 RepID=A0A1W1HF42_9BACT|nr:M23 family metallopeptidase [Desulfamplus magnetovallimortis]SLM31109.1 Peptidase M23/M37 family protein [Desulfamplus magnetovallimortis]
MKKILFFIFFIGVVLPFLWFIFNIYEGKQPEISLKLPSLYLTDSYELNLEVSDKGTGLRQVLITITQGTKEKNLVNKKFPFKGYLGILKGVSGSGVMEDNVKIPLESWKYGMGDGEAVIKIVVSDFSWRGWNKGNIAEIEKKVVIDTRPPEVEVLSKTHNISRGGTGLVIYRIKEENVKSGIQVGDHFYPGYSGMFNQKNIMAVFFALSHEQGPGTEIFVKAEDLAGNIAKRGFYHYIKEKKFRSDVLNISDSFLQSKMPEFDLGVQDIVFEPSDKGLLDKFIYINRNVRKLNIEKILKPVAETDSTLMWKDRFLRLPGSATRAKFADHRIYKHNGKEIDRQTHMGIDLASVAHAEVPASNAGRVIGVDNIGIFGKSVLIDHGFGLCSSYAHLSSIFVKKGDMVKKGDIIAKTGATGLAGGDHLHFAISVHDVFVNPVEWWDQSWIDNNIYSKIDDVRQEFGN